MLVVAPLWGLLACRGWAWLANWFSLRRPYAWAAAASLLPVLANMNYRVIPINLDDDARTARAVAEWVDTGADRSAYPLLTAAHPGVFYFLDVSATDGRRAREWKQSTIRDAPPGTLAVWDSIYALYNADETRRVTEQDLLDAGWTVDPDAERALAPHQPATRPAADRWDAAFQPTGTRWRVFRSPRPAR
jgi:hypothetical protein